MTEPDAIALGYHCADFTDLRIHRERKQMRDLADRFGYTYAKTVNFPSGTDDPVQRLVNVILHYGAEALIVPTLAVFDDGVIPHAVMELVEVTSVEPQRTYSRRDTVVESPIAPMRGGDIPDDADSRSCGTGR